MPSSRASATISSPRVAGKRSGCPLFDERDLAEIASPDFPGERLVACRNPALAVERARTREALLQSTERQLERIAATVARKPAKSMPLRSGSRFRAGAPHLCSGSSGAQEVTTARTSAVRSNVRVQSWALLDPIVSSD